MQRGTTWSGGADNATSSGGAGGAAASSSRRILIGADFGKVTTSLAWGHLADDGALAIDGTRAERHMGEPLAPFFSLYREIGGERIAGVVSTGAFGDRLAAPVLGGVPEEIALERAAELLEGASGPLNLVRIGGSGYSVLTRDAGGRVECDTNERCSAGTGETVEGLCSRLGRTLDEAVALAATADRGIAITSRCAVFAKSELTHFANQGEDHGRLFLGLFESVARNVLALYERVKVDGPVVLVGHGALIAPLAAAFAAQSGAPVTVSPQAGVYEALGALRFAAQRAPDRGAAPDVPWPADPTELVVPRRGRIRALAPAHAGPGSVVQLGRANGDGRTAADAESATRAAADARGTAAKDGNLRPDVAAAAGLILGLDLGSSGSKAVLYDPASGTVLVDVYRRTDGNPVEAAKRLVDELRAARPDDLIVAIGLTGSGRDAAATVMRAAYPKLGARLTVLNEIVAHATAAVRYDAGGGRSLSIVEIGGQDAKFINVRDGRVLESDMNRVCSAGTGSFLEEQAQANGLDDIALFGEQAARAQRPPDLGQTCTVFVADVAAEALADGFTRDDIFAGLQFSVIKNYIGRVMGDRRFLDRIFFQGKPATNPSLARTLAAVTGREVVVPPDPGAMGALGISMLAAQAVEVHTPDGETVGAASGATSGATAGVTTGATATEPPSPIDLEPFLSATVVKRSSGRCGDKQCSNLCHLETAIIEVAGDRRRVISGGNCPKYESVSAVGEKLPKDAPNPYREREELLTSLIAESRAAAVAAAEAADADTGSALPRRAADLAASLSGRAAALPGRAASLPGRAADLAAALPGRAAALPSRAAELATSLPGRAADLADTLPGRAADLASDLVAPTGSSRPLAGRRVGLPYAHYLVDSLPFFDAWLATLGAEVEVLWPSAETLAEGDRRCAAPGACGPVKIAHGLTGAIASPAPAGPADPSLSVPVDGAALDVLFAPKIINLPASGAGGTYTCPIAQGTPEMIESALRAEGIEIEVVRPVLFRSAAGWYDDADFVEELEEAARELGASGAAARAAHQTGLAAQRRYEDGLRRIGERALGFAREHGHPVVLVVGETHVVHDPVMNSGIHDLIAANGALAVPVDCFPIEAGAAKLSCVHWAGGGRALRASVAATAIAGVFPMLMCAYGCGPNSFVEHLFDDLLADYPHTVLESDGHGGAAGYVTRVQAFLHSVQGYREHRPACEREQEREPGREAPAPADATPVVAPERLRRCDVPVYRSLRHNRERTFLFGNMGGAMSRQVAAAMRGAGLDARAVGTTSAAALEKARAHCSGKECLPYQLIWGTLAEYLGEHGSELGEDGAVFVSIGRGFQACRANLFPVTQQIQLERLGYDGRIQVADFTMLFEDWALTSAAWLGMAANDLLNMMRFYRYATEPRRGAADEVYGRYADRLEAVLAAPRQGQGARGRAGDARGRLSEVQTLIGEAAREFAALDHFVGDGHGQPTIFLCGDIYLRVDEWGNDDLQRKLADQGLRVIFEPFGEIFELLALRDVRQHGLTSRHGAARAATLKFMRLVVTRLLAAAREHEPWMFWNDVSDVWEASEPLLDGYPFGESIATIGGALHAWQTRPVDGVVVVSPRGCGPALVSEAQLRRGADFPLLFVYNDGDPIDEARLAGFAWRLREREPRASSARVVATRP